MISRDSGRLSSPTKPQSLNGPSQYEVYPAILPKYFKVEGNCNVPFRFVQLLNAASSISSTPSGIIRDPVSILQSENALPQIFFNLSGSTRLVRLFLLVRASPGISSSLLTPLYSILGPKSPPSPFTILTSFRLRAERLVISLLITPKSLAVIVPVTFRFLTLLTSSPLAAMQASSVPGVSTFMTTYSLAIPSCEVLSFSHTVMLSPLSENS